MLVRRVIVAVRRHRAASSCLPSQTIVARGTTLVRLRATLERPALLEGKKEAAAYAAAAESA